MKYYEMIREIYDQCSCKPHSQISEIETDDLDAFVKSKISRTSTCEKTISKDGSITYEIMTGDIRERYIFTED